MGEAVIVIDFETTGLSPQQGARATEVAAVVLEGNRMVARFHSLMNAGVRIPSYIEALTGISNAMIRDAPPAAEVMREFASFIEDFSLVAHNASFDRKFLEAELDRIRLGFNNDFICSMRVARRIYPEAPSHSLSTLVKYAKVPSAGRHHRALADAEMAAHLWLAMRMHLLEKYKLSDVSLELMRSLQSIPRYALQSHLARYLGITSG